MIEPIYVTERANAAVVLGSARAEISGREALLSGDCEAIFQLLPRPRLVIAVTVPQSITAHDALQLFEQRIVLKYGASRPTPVMVLRSMSGPPGMATGTTRIELLPKSGNVTICPNSRRRLSSMIVHIMNFPVFLSFGNGGTNSRIRTPQGGRRVVGRAVLCDSDWRVEIQELPEAANLVRQLDADGGYAITHVARITRRAAQTFSVSAAERIVRELHLFLSFARGAWVGVVAPVGFNARGDRAYEDWSMLLSTPWEPTRTWFDKHHGQSLTMLFPGFLRLIRDADMGKAVSSALYWYLRSNRAGEGAGVDSGIILSQAALERLALAYLERGGEAVAGRAADKLRLAWLRLKLPTRIPESATRLQAGRRKGAWADAAEAMTGIRNDLVHPKPRLKLHRRECIPEAWNLSQWYIELFLLRLSDYSGMYSNRLRSRWVGEVENVPWVRARQDRCRVAGE